MARIQTIFVENLRQIKQQTLSLNGCTAVVIGGNNKGKTTLCRALMDRLRGIKDENIVNTDYSEGWYEMQLTNGEKLTWSINQKGKEKLTLITDRNIKTSITKDISAAYFPKVFDIDKFLNEIPSKQKKILEKVSGLDFAEVDKAYNAACEERKWANKKLQEEKAKMILFEPHWKEEPQNDEQYQKELQDLSAHNLRYNNIRSKLEEKKHGLAFNIRQIELKQEQIAKLQNEILELQEQDMQLETEIDKGTIWLNEEKNKPKDDNAKLALIYKINDIRKNNEAVLRKKELDKAEKEAFDVDQQIQTILRDKAEMIRLADMPEGFGFSEDGITYNGLPFERKCLSSSALYIAALKLATRGLGEVRVLHFDASFLDKNSLEEVCDWAEKNNLQLLIERPDFEGGEITYEIIETNE